MGSLHICYMNLSISGKSVTFIVTLRPERVTYDDRRETAVNVERVIAEAKAGDPEAFCLIVAEYEAMVRGYLARFVLDANDVFDLAQETFLAAYRRLSSFDEGGDLASWLRGIARTTTLKFFRQMKRRRQHEANAVELKVWQYYEQKMNQGQVQSGPSLEKLQHCVDRMSTNQTKAFQLLQMRYFQDLPIAAIAREMRTKEGAVRMALLRLRDTLRKCVEGGVIGREFHHA